MNILSITIYHFSKSLYNTNKGLYNTNKTRNEKIVNNVNNAFIDL